MLNDTTVCAPAMPAQVYGTVFYPWTKELSVRVYFVLPLTDDRRFDKGRLVPERRQSSLGYLRPAPP